MSSHHQISSQPKPAAANDLEPLAVIEVQGFLDDHGRRLFVATDERARTIARGLALDTDEKEKASIRAQLSELVEAYKNRPRLSLLP